MDEERKGRRMERKEEGKKNEGRRDREKRREHAYTLLLYSVIFYVDCHVFFFLQNRFLVVFTLYSSKGIILSFFLKLLKIITLFSLHLHSQFPIPSHFFLFISSYPLSTRQTRHPPRPPLPSLPSPFHPSFFLDSSSPPPPTVSLKPFLRPPYPPPPPTPPARTHTRPAAPSGRARAGIGVLGNLCLCV